MDMEVQQISDANKCRIVYFMNGKLARVSFIYCPCTLTAKVARQICTLKYKPSYNYYKYLKTAFYDCDLYINTEGALTLSSVETFNEGYWMRLDETILLT